MNETHAAGILVHGCSQSFRGIPRGRAGNETIIDALSIAAEGSKAAIAKPLNGLGSGVFEIALTYKGNAFRVVYAVQLGDDLWVVHAFQKKSTHGIKTPQREIDLIRDRIKRLKEILR